MEQVTQDKISYDEVIEIIRVSKGKIISQDGPIFTVLLNGNQFIVDHEKQIYLISGQEDITGGSQWWNHSENPVTGNSEIHTLARRMIYSNGNTEWVAPYKTYAVIFDEWISSWFVVNQ